MSGEFERIIEFTMQFEHAKGWKNYGFTDSRDFLLADGTKLPRPAIKPRKTIESGTITEEINKTDAEIEAEARELYRRVIYSKNQGYDLEALPAPLATMAVDIAVNQYDVGGTLVLAANKLGADIRDSDGIAFDKTRRDVFWFDKEEGAKTKNASISYQQTTSFRVYEQNKQKIIDTYNQDPQKFLDALAQIRLEMYRRSSDANLKKHMEEWAERTFANHGLASAMVGDAGNKVTTDQIAPTYITKQTLYTDAAKAFSASIGAVSTIKAPTQSADTKTWYDKVDRAALDSIQRIKKQVAANLKPAPQPVKPVTPQDTLPANPAVPEPPPAAKKTADETLTATNDKSAIPADHKVVKGDTLYKLMKNGDEKVQALLAKTKEYIGGDPTDKTVALTLALIVARKNGIGDADYILVDQNLKFPNSEEVKIAVAAMKADILSDTKISWKNEMRGYDVENLVPVSRQNGMLVKKSAPAV